MKLKKWDIKFNGVGVTYPNGKKALKSIDLEINEGELISIIGLSGAGKTTLLKTINLINPITTGNIIVGDTTQEAYEHRETLKAELKALKLIEKEKLTEKESKRIDELNVDLDNRDYVVLKKLKGKLMRSYRTNVGMVFQRYNLINNASVLKNVLTAKLPNLPWYKAAISLYSKEDKQIALEALAQVNILETAYAKAKDLSGGQMQRVALARTIAQDAKIILADEPVGALDPIMAKSVMDSFYFINKTQERTVIMNLHHVELALQYTDRIIGVKNGEVVFDGKSEEVDLTVLKKIYGDQLEGFGKHELDEVKRKRKILLDSNKFGKTKKASTTKKPTIKKAVAKKAPAKKTVTKK